MSERSLVEWRKSLDLSQRGLAKLCSHERGSTVYQHQICGWENGEPMSGSTRAFFRRLMERYPDKGSLPQTIEHDAGNA